MKKLLLCFLATLTITPIHASASEPGEVKNDFDKAFIDKLHLGMPFAQLKKMVGASPVDEGEGGYHWDGPNTMLVVEVSHGKVTYIDADTIDHQHIVIGGKPDSAGTKAAEDTNLVFTREFGLRITRGMTHSEVSKLIGATGSLVPWKAGSAIQYLWSGGHNSDITVYFDHDHVISWTLLDQNRQSYTMDQNGIVTAGDPPKRK